MAQTSRRRSKSARGADSAFGYIIPLFFLAWGTYQQITTGNVDKYVAGCLLVFGLAALGWRVDIMFDSYIRAKYGTTPPIDISSKGGESNDR